MTSISVQQVAFVAAVLLFVAPAPLDGRKHHLVIHSDSRRYFSISTFGFYTGGFLAVNVSHFHVLNGASSSGDAAVKADADTHPVGFTIDKTSNHALKPFAETSVVERCILAPHRPLPSQPSEDSLLRFVMDFSSGRTLVECSDNLQSITILPNRDHLDDILNADAGQAGHLSDTSIFGSRKVNKAHRRRKRDDNATAAVAVPVPTTVPAPKNRNCLDVHLPLTNVTTSEGVLYSTSFVMYVANEKEEGLYSLYFHNCHNYHRNGYYTGGGSAEFVPGGRSDFDTDVKHDEKVHVSFIIDIEEKNHDSYLSAGEMPLPALYLLMSVLFFLSGCFWVFILRKNGSEQVFRIHWIMASLVFLKSLSLFFHGVNYHKIETNGFHIETWAILYYVTHLLKGGLLFFTIVLIGSGWAFIKHILSDKEKRVFIFVLPLQVIANVAYIIIEESEEGEMRHNSWKEIFILVDLMCCGAILFPVVWSIRHLQDSSGTDGKAVSSLEKLKLFRHFYVMVVCYIYFTRIIVYLLKITVPFQYEWLDEMFKEMATFVFFVATGYKFRPASNNPYFSVPTDDYDMEEVLIGGTSLQEQVVNRKKAAGGGTTARAFVDDEDESDDDEGMVFFPTGTQQQQQQPDSRAESSHDLD